MKYLITASSIISIACGYTIGKSTSSVVKETQSASKAESRYDHARSGGIRLPRNGNNALLDSILGGRPVSQIPPADLAAIFINLSKPDPNANDLSRGKQAYQIELLLSKLSAQELANIATELSSDPETKNSPATTNIISALAAKDPERALDWIATQEDSSKLYPVIISSIAIRDPHSAASLLRSAMIDGKIAKSKIQPVVSDIANSTAKLGAESFFSYLDSLPIQLQTGLIYDSVSKIPENDSIKFLEQLHQRSQDGRLGESYMNYVFSKTITKNKTAAAEWLNKLPENEQKNNLRTRAAESLYLSGDKESGIEWMKEAIAASPGREKEILHNVIQDLRLNEPEGIPDFANLLPDGQKFAAKDIFYSPTDGSEGIPILASAISDPNEKSIFIAKSLKKICRATDGESPLVESNDLDILSRQIAAMGFTGQNATRVNDAIEAAKNQISPKN